MAMETGNTFVAMDRKCEGGDGVAGNINRVAGAGASAGSCGKGKAGAKPDPPPPKPHKNALLIQSTTQNTLVKVLHADLCLIV
jgi:hypothetical protein